MARSETKSLYYQQVPKQRNNECPLSLFGPLCIAIDARFLHDRQVFSKKKKKLSSYCSDSTALIMIGAIIACCLAFKKQVSLTIKYSDLSLKLKISIQKKIKNFLVNTNSYMVIQIFVRWYKSS